MAPNHRYADDYENQEYLIKKPEYRFTPDPESDSGSGEGWRAVCFGKNLL